MATFDFEGKKVYYERHGDKGRPLVVLNGLMMSTTSWKPFVEDFSRNNQLVLVDFLDQGRSSRMSESYYHDVQIRLVDALLDELGWEKAVIMGLSYGGNVAIQYALAHPERVWRLILANSGCRTSPWLQKIGDGWNEVAASGSGLAYYLTTIPTIYSTRFFEENAAWMDSREATLTEYFSDPEVLARLGRLTASSRPFNVSDRLGEITCPTLILSGSEDNLVPVTEQQMLRDGIRGSSHVILSGSGHATMYEYPSAFAALVVGFANLGDDGIAI